jgi:hypothetical protein
MEVSGRCFPDIPTVSDDWPVTEVADTRSNETAEWTAELVVIPGTS